MYFTNFFLYFCFILYYNLLLTFYYGDIKGKFSFGFLLVLFIVLFCSRY